MGLCAGTSETWVQCLRDFRAAGAQKVVIRFAGPDQTGQLERCADEVIPQV
jgi:hypothetical protein